MTRRISWCWRRLEGVAANQDGDKSPFVPSHRHIVGKLKRILVRDGIFPLASLVGRSSLGLKDARPDIWNRSV